MSSCHTMWVRAMGDRHDAPAVRSRLQCAVISCTLRYDAIERLDHEIHATIANDLRAFGDCGRSWECDQSTRF